MPQTDDIMGHCDHFLPDFYYLNGNFISQNQLGSPSDFPRDLAGYDPFSRMKDQQPCYQNDAFYAPTYPPTTTSIHEKQRGRPLSHTNKVWSSHFHFGGVLDSPVVPISVALASQAPPTPPPSQPTWTTELPPIDSDTPFIPNDHGHGVYTDRKRHLLLSPLNDFRLQNLPNNNSPLSVMPQGVRESSGETSSSLSSFDMLSSPDSSPDSDPCYLSCHGEPWMSPASVATDTDDDSSLASSISSLSPDVFDQDAFPGEIPIDDDNESLYFCRSPGKDSIYHPLEQYPLRTSPLSGHDGRFIPEANIEDDDLSPLTFSPPSLPLLSLSESEHQSTSAASIRKSPIYKPPSPSPSLYKYHSFFDYDSSIPPPSPSRRRSATLPELEPTNFSTDPFGLHKSLPAEERTSLSPPPLHDIEMDGSHMRWRSLPGWETDDDLIPVELASKNYIPDPSAIVPTTSSGTRSLLLWDHDYDNHPDRSDIPTPRSPSPENFYLDPSVLAQCGDEEMQKVYELRQRTAKNKKWERERCRELSALLRLKLDERGVLSGSGDCGNHQSESRSPPYYSNLPFSSSPSSDSLMDYQPQTPSSSSSLSSSTQNPILIPTSSSPSSTLPSTLGKPQIQFEGPKHKIRSMAQLVASMIFHRQRDTLRRHLSRKAGFEPTSTHSSPYHPHPSTMGVAGTKVLPTPRSRLSKVILPEELEMDSEEEGQELGREVESGEEDMNVDLDDRPLSRGCMDMDLDERGSCGSSSSHNVTAVPLCTPTSTQ